MQTRMKCSCGWEFWAESASPGEAVPCPACGRMVTAEGADSDIAPTDPAAPTPEPRPTMPQVHAQPMPWSPDRGAAKPQTGSLFGQPVEGAAPPPEPAVPPVQAPPVYAGPVQAGPKKPQGLAVASMVCGILSLIGCPVCFWPFGVVGILLGTVAATMGIVSLLKKRGGRGMAIAGSITGGVGALISLASVSFFTWVFWSASTHVPAASYGPTTWPTPVMPGGISPVPPVPSRVPTVLPGDTLIEAVTGPLNMPENAARAEGTLRDALADYRKRGRGTKFLARCVQSFREHLAYAGRTEPADAEHAKRYRAACDELVDCLLADYRQAGQLEQDGKWQEAKDAYDRILSDYLLDDDGPVAGNVREHSQWCQYKKAEAETPAYEFDDDDDF